MKKFLILFAVSVLLLSWTLTASAQSVIKLNEIYTRGTPGNLDWIELYNTSSSPVNIGGYKIYDDGGQSGKKGKKLIPAGTVISAKGFYIIITDTATFVGDTTAFGLSNNGDAVWLENASGTIIDTCAIPALGTDTSYARIPDGANIWKKTTPVTKGKANSIGTSVRRENAVASDFALGQNYPNPFNPSTTIGYRLPEAAMVTLTVFDIIGREVAVLVSGRQEAGTYTASFNASALPSGMYLYQLKAGSSSAVKKMILTK